MMVARARRQGSKIFLLVRCCFCWFCEVRLLLVRLRRRFLVPARAGPVFCSVRLTWPAASV